MWEKSVETAAVTEESIILSNKDMVINGVMSNSVSISSFLAKLLMRGK